MRRRSAPDSVNLTPMIDIVFQMIIFFVFTMDLDRAKFDEAITPPDSKNGETVETFEPATIYAQVTEKGNIKLGTAIFPPDAFRAQVRQAVKRYGQGVPVQVYGDGKAEHRYVRRVMDICSSEGLWKINIMGIKEHSSSKKKAGTP